VTYVTQPETRETRREERIVHATSLAVLASYFLLGLALIA
jgi:hypothetical protein